MKHKIIFLFIVMIAMAVGALLMFENAPVIARHLGVSTKMVDMMSVALFGSGIFPSASINEILTEARNEDSRESPE